MGTTRGGCIACYVTVPGRAAEQRGKMAQLPLKDQVIYGQLLTLLGSGFSHHGKGDLS